MRTIIALANEKGGVAKTTTTISLGGALVEAGKEVLLIDLDAQANLTLGLGLEPGKIRRSIAGALLNNAPLQSLSRETPIAGLDLIPSNADMLSAERFLTIRPNYETILAGLLADLSNYDFVLLDCPPSLGAVTRNALTAGDMVIIPTQPEYYSVNGLKGLLASIRQVRSQNNPQLNYRVLITMMDRRNRIHNTLNAQIRSTFGEGVFENCIETDTKLRESSVVGLPITHYYPRSRSATQYRALAAELIEDVKSEAAQPA